MIGSAAIFSPCETWRYTLTRRWAEGSTVNFICLNPSTATATVDDPTIRRCIAYAKAWGYAALEVTNIFAYRSTSPKILSYLQDPIGPENNHYLELKATEAKTVVVAWGVHGSINNRYSEVLRLLRSFDLFCLKWTKDGSPSHPLYLAKSAERHLYLSARVSMTQEEHRRLYTQRFPAEEDMR